MCGIAGFIDFSRRLAHPEPVLEAMHRCITPRGPDDHGIWFDRGTGAGFAHRRLSIVDLSPEGRQPMVSESGRYRIVFNGEVYNFPELRAELEPLGHRFRGHSDTEVMLAAVEQWGIEAAIRRFVGMFAFALHDARERVLHLVRDRVGIKPLYWGWVGPAAGSAHQDLHRSSAPADSIFAFASELRPFLEIPGFERRIDRDALSAYMRFAYVPQPFSIWRGVHKLRPGHLLTIRLDGGAVTSTCWWNARAVAERGVADPLDLSDDEALEGLEARLRNAVELRLVADVPLGAFLSGGIDSSTVVAIMQELSPRPVKTFTIGFTENEYDEARFAREVARHLGTDHTELMLSPEETLATVPLMPEIYDEPFADSSQVPTFLVSRLARRAVTVSLSGDGGDELFGGYNRYLHGDAIWQRLRRVPRPLRRGVGALVGAVPQSALGGAYSAVSRLLPPRYRQRFAGTKFQKLAIMSGARSGDEVYRSLISMWNDPDGLVIDGREPLEMLEAPYAAELPDLVRRMMYADLVTYLVDDILTKVDRASMAVSLEARVPLLDHRVVEYAWRLPLRHTMGDGRGKALLRRVLERRVPRHLFERPKMGFSVPVDEWLRGPLREWAESLLAPDRLRREGFLRPEPVQREWQRYLRGLANHTRPWAVLMFQSWVDRYRPIG